jgi:hypothetical protein
MNNNGQAVMVGLMIAMAVIVLLLGSIGTYNQVTAEAQTSMSCTTTTDAYVQAGCLISDVSVPYFFAAILGLAGLGLLARYYSQ